MALSLLLQTRPTQDDWYEACNLYQSEYHQMKQSVFLRSSVSGEVFMESRAEQQASSTKLKLFDKGELGKEKMLSQRQRELANIENKLVEYIELRERRYKIDKCGISWCTLRNKALQYASALEYSSDIFHASDEWIFKVVERHNKKGINLLGEANDMTTEEREKLMAEWRPQFHTLLEKYDIPSSRVYNGD